MGAIGLKKIDRNRAASRSWIRNILCSGLAVLLSIHVFIFLLLISAFLLATFISTLFSVGREQAKKDFRSEFKDSSALMMTDPAEKLEREHKVVECSMPFCTIYREGKIYTVAAFKLEWAISIPDKN